MHKQVATYTMYVFFNQCVLTISFAQNALRAEHFRNRIFVYPFHIFSDIMKLQMGIGDKIFTFAQWVTTFIAGYTVGFVQGWKLTLVILAVAPLMVVAVGFIAVVCKF